MSIQPLASSSKGNCYLVDDGKTKLLLDAGISWGRVREALNFKTHEIQGILITHVHGDHVKAAKDAMKAGVDVYLSKETADKANLQGHRLCIIEAGRQFSIGSWIIQPFDAVHDVHTLGFVLESSAGDRILFLTDSAYSKYRFAGLTHIMVECNNVGRILENRIQTGKSMRSLGGRIRRTHMSLERLIEMLKANDLSRCRQIYLLHLSDTNSDEAEMKRRVQEETGVPVTVTKE